MSESGHGDNCTNWTLAQARPTMDRFLARYRNSGNIRASCKAADVSRSTIYYWRDKYVTFARQMKDAKEDAVDALDLEAWRRATDGASDRLLMFLLKAHKPEVYNPVQNVRHEGTGKDGAIPIITEVIVQIPGDDGADDAMDDE